MFKTNSLSLPLNNYNKFYYLSDTQKFSTTTPRPHHTPIYNEWHTHHSLYPQQRVKQEELGGFYPYPLTHHHNNDLLNLPQYNTNTTSPYPISLSAPPYYSSQSLPIQLPYLRQQNHIAPTTKVNGRAYAKLQCRACGSHVETANSLQARFTLPPVHQKYEYDVRNAREDDPSLPLPTKFDTAQSDHVTTDDQYGASTSAGGGNFTSRMFSGNSCFTGGSYYHVRGNAHFSPPLSQIPPGLMILYQNISASACHNSRERYPPPRCHPSTRKEILRTIIDHIAETPSYSKIIHLVGSEGTGKSAIAQTIAEYYKPIGTLGACFFFSRTSSERNTDKNLIATLAYQLCVNIPGLKPFIVKAVEEDLSTFQKDVDTQLERLIINPIVQAKDECVIQEYPILIVIDGIDECDGMKEQHTFLRAVSAAMGRHHLPLNFVITSRPEIHIVNWLNHDPTICSTSYLLDLDLNHTDTKRDIEIYVRSEFDRIRSVHHMPESLVWPSQASIQTLVSETNMSFRRASGIIAFIDDQKDSPQNRLEDILRTSTQSCSAGLS